MLSSLTWGEFHPFHLLANNGHEVRNVKFRKKKSSSKVKKQFDVVLSLLESCGSVDMHQNPLEKTESTTHNKPKTGEIEEYISSLLKQPCFDWSCLPRPLDPEFGGGLPASRAVKKRQQIENLIYFVSPFLKPKSLLVEFCSGSGHVSLPLAHLFPQCHFIMIDKNPVSIQIGQERILESGLQNIEIVQSLIQECSLRFDVGIALHACGEATDIAIDQCLSVGATFVVAPCCVGKVQRSTLHYPRSKRMGKLLSRNSYDILASAGDFGHTSIECTHLHQRRQQCKLWIEADRSWRAMEANYNALMFKMHPIDATPKNDIIVGWSLANADTQDT